ncbi:hypothetical protein TH53_11255 [Pedobacter lusitanus]|uniref:HTH luxR-type domain-containing protein n=1 Tax=Pedobacter lusitanus TaxID=1503925 RepID=A0A0D0GIK7_9SPHI|nr:tetratricopeptide repeat protein [Pedobacter lusitanus]KIO77102.1 hypothetical protein TH53_11255 [Pedobacter lusitanus]
MLIINGRVKPSELCCFIALFLISLICFDAKADPVKAVPDPVREKITRLNKKAAGLNRDSTNQAIAYAYEAYLMAYENKFKEQEADALSVLAEGYLYNDIYDLALEYAFNALEIYKKQANQEKISATYTLLGWIYYDVENAEFALKYHTQAYELYKKLGNQNKAAVSLNGIGLIYQLKNEFRKANAYFNQALSIAGQYKNQALISAAYNNLGISSNNTNDYNQAITYFNQSMQHSTGNLLSLAEVNNQMAFSLIRLGRYPEGLAALNKARAYIDQSTSNSKKENLLDNYKVFSLLYKLTGDYKQAYINIDKYNTVREEFLSKNKVNALITLTMKREAQEKEREIKALSLEKSLKSYQRNTLAIIIVLLFVIGFLLYNKLRAQQRKKAELAQMQQQLIQKELELTVSDKVALNNKLEFNHTELKNYALYMSHRNELITDFLAELNTLAHTYQEELSSKLYKLINKFRYDINIEKYLEDFNLQIEAKYQDFFYNLRQKFPTLTQNEIRLSAQIRLNLSIKEIASLNNISVKSVEMARYRLRKHFDLTQQDNLNDFLKSF